MSRKVHGMTPSRDDIESARFHARCVICDLRSPWGHLRMRLRWRRRYGRRVERIVFGDG